MSYLNCAEEKEPNPIPSVLEQLFETIFFYLSLPPAWFYFLN